MVIKKRREPNEKGYTHYAQLDTWKPDGSQIQNTESEAEQSQTNDDSKLPWDD